jgi:protein-disulfide isomerase
MKQPLTFVALVVAVVSMAAGWLAGRFGASNPKAPNAAVTLSREQFEDILRVVREEAAAARVDRERDRDAAGAGSRLPERHVTLSIAGAPSLGPPAAPVTIIEFSDFQCPHCATMAPVLERIVREYPQKVRLVFKHCPLPTHPQALGAHRAAVAAQHQGKFWEMHDRLFAHPEKLLPQGLREEARALGLNLEQFEEDMASQDTYSRIALDRGEANAAGIAKVPTFFVNGRKLEGAQPFEVLRVEVEAELAARDEERGGGGGDAAERR